MTVCLLVVIMGNTILNVALPTLQRELGATQGELQWAVDAYIVVFAGLLFSWGVVGDRIGRRKVLLIGLSIFALGSVLAAFSASPLAAHPLPGGDGHRRRGRPAHDARRHHATSSRPASAAAPSGSGPARRASPSRAGRWPAAPSSQHFWWGAIFLIGVPVAVLGIVGVLAFVPESRDPNPGRLDVPGVLLSIVALAGLVYGLIRGGAGEGWTTPGVLVPLIGGIVLLAVFVWLQRRSSHPALDVSLFRNPAFSAAATALGLNFFALLGATFYLVYYLQGVRGYTPLQSGAALIPIAAGHGAHGPAQLGPRRPVRPQGRLRDRVRA